MFVTYMLCVHETSIQNMEASQQEKQIHKYREQTGGC